MDSGPDQRSYSRRVTRATPTIVAVLAVLGSACGGPPSASEVDKLPTVDSSLVVGEAMRFEQGTHCGFRVLDAMINGQVWRAESATTADWIPSGWRPNSSTPDGPIEIQLVLDADQSTIVASLNGTEVTYIAGGNEWLDSDLCS